MPPHSAFDSRVQLTDWHKEVLGSKRAGPMEKFSSESDGSPVFLAAAPAHSRCWRPFLTSGRPRLDTALDTELGNFGVDRTNAIATGQF